MATSRELAHQHQLLIANCLAQSEALMRGRTTEEARAQLIAGALRKARRTGLRRTRRFRATGLRSPWSMTDLTPFALGRLIALYEHRVFVEAQIFGINAFDQWGVELGKELATALLPVVKGESSGEGHDARPLCWQKTIRTMRGGA
jgi:glucose-6-phosphate isomerase